jgi:hypothetical protein
MTESVELQSARRQIDELKLKLEHEQNMAIVQQKIIIKLRNQLDIIRTFMKED